MAPPSSGDGMMDRKFNVTVHAYTRYPHEFRESHSFQFKANSLMDAEKKIKAVTKELLPSGEYTLDFIFEEDTGEDKEIPIGPAPKVWYS